jgi:hypothetical protein
MIDVRVIAAQGATLRGPAVLRLSKEQHLTRAHVLGPRSNDGRCHLGGGREITLKFGEVFGMEDGANRLNTVVFHQVETAQAKTRAAKPGSDAP